MAAETHVTTTRKDITSYFESYPHKPTCLIVAIDPNGGIGFEGKIPWSNKTDLNTFQSITSRCSHGKINALIMGKNSWLSIPPSKRSLSNRHTIVLSNTIDDEYLTMNNNTKEPTSVFNNLQQALKYCYTTPHIEQVFICGGYQLFEESMKRNIIDTAYITHIKKEYQCDAFFPIDVFNNNFTEVHNMHDDEDISIIQYRLNINSGERGYLSLLQKVLTHGESRETRNATTKAIFQEVLKFDLEQGFPLLTTKYVYWPNIVRELLFFLKGSTDATILSKNGTRIWNANTTRAFLDNRHLEHYNEGDMGPMYGWNWRHFGGTYTHAQADYTNVGHDQLAELLKELKFNPNSRRLLLTTYDPSKVDQSVLAPCHGISTQFFVSNDKKLSCCMTQRSVDSFLGLPYNIASYGLMTHILAHVCGYGVGTLSLCLNDVHIYEIHEDAVREQLSRSDSYLPFPTFRMNKTFTSSSDESFVKDALNYIEHLDIEDFMIANYRYHPRIVADMVA